MSGSPLKVLVAAHSHPRLTNGGAEIAAYQLYEDLKSRPDCRAWFLGCQRDSRLQKPGAAISQPFGADEFLYAAQGFDWFKFSNPDPNFPPAFRALLDELKPDVVHLHHYAVLGLESLLHVRRALPDARIVVTLHEYLAICNHFGQMVTREGAVLCHEASPIRCSRCFPALDASDFFLRERYIRRFLDLADHFIAPSRFLADRYVAWGLPPGKLTLIENLIPSPLNPPPARPRLEGEPLRVGFFGQISALKGIKVLFDAAAILEDDEMADVSFEIHGDYSGQPPQFQADFLEQAANVGRNVTLHGPYDRERVDQLMARVDLVVVPSVWWENSPVVIQEALRNRKPVVCSDIGGMAEKVRDGIDGFHFPVGDPMALAALLKRLAADRARIAEASAAMRTPPAAKDVGDRHWAVYGEGVRA